MGTEDVGFPASGRRAVPSNNEVIACSPKTKQQQQQIKNG
jgi:hypothetical protein